MLVSYNWLKDYLGDALPSPERVAELLTFHAFEIESVEAKGDDTIIDIKILPDRSSDCLSHRGIAREIATQVGVSLTHDPLTNPVLPATTDAIKVAIADPVLCTRFTASIVTGITVGESPAWLRTRLAALGQRSINNIVDATNYVMYAMGQPLHAYDADKFPKVDGAWRFGVRPASAGETVSLLAEGGKDEDRIVTLKGGELLIIDDSLGAAIGLAGVKGGRFAGVDASTTNIIIEAANFNPTLTRKTARGLGIVIDASKRFENEPSRELPPYAQREIIKLITEIAGGTCEGFVDVYPTPVTMKTVLVSSARVNALLGLSLPAEDMVAILKRIGATVKQVDAATLSCMGPFERTDLNLEEDYIAEIGRVYGYQHVVSVVPPAVPLKEINARHYYSEVVRETLLVHGFGEVITSSFRKKDDVKLLSSLASDKGYLRSSLMPGMHEALDKNASFVDLLGATDTRMCEIGTVFHKAEGTVQEHVALCFGVRLKQTGYSGKEDAIVASIVLALEAALGTNLVFTTTKGVAEINFSEVIARLPVPASYQPVVKTKDVAYQAFSMYPAVTRDIAMWVGEGTEVAAVVSVLDAAAGPLRVRTTHVDAFTKDGRTSLAFRLVFQAHDRTLTDEAVNSVMEQVYAAATNVGWQTR